MSEQQPELVAIYLTNATRTSGGNGPGVVRVPPGEAGRLVRERRGVYGDKPPRGFLDGGVDTRHSNVGLMMPRTERR